MPGVIFEKMVKSTFLESIEKGLQVLKIDFHDDSWRNPRPSGPGWYFIESNTPPTRFFEVGKPKGERHYPIDIPEKAEASLSLEKIGACISPSESPFYFVYSGEAKNLKARAREHVWGHLKTDCLALGNYPLSHNYKWIT